MKLRTRLAATAGITLALLVAAASAHEYTIGSIEIGHPWTRPTPPGAPTAAGYMTLTNNDTKDDRLVSAETDLAAVTELHRSEMVDGVMRMRAQPEGLVLPAGETVRLEPGGYHLMLIDVERPFAAGERIPVTLTFESAGTVTVELSVDAPKAHEPADTHVGH